jgi:hypothetical protein
VQQLISRVVQLSLHAHCVGDLPFSEFLREERFPPRRLSDRRS